tara:strand:+ start:59 stop:385 length:327 start_codon:yes stop_codon:yes gene_type:complete
MTYETDLEIIINDDFIIGVDVKIDYTIEHNSIEWYEYGGGKFYDSGDYEVTIDKYTLINIEDYQYTKEEQDFIDSNNLIDWLEKNDPDYHNWILNNIYSYDNNPKNHY